MKRSTLATLVAALLTSASHAQLQQACINVNEPFFINSSVGGFVQTADGGFASAGAFAEGNSGYSDIGVTKFDANGTVQWMHKLSAGANLGVIAQSLIPQSDGSLVIAGPQNFTSPNAGVFIAKLDAAGTVLWAKTYSSSSFNLLGSFYADGFVQTSDGGFAWNAYKSFPDASYCMMRTDANGNLLWSDELRYTEEASDVAALPNGDLIFTGWSDNGAALTLRKDGLTGTTEWMHWYKGAAEDVDAFGLAIGVDSTIVLGGGSHVPLPNNPIHLTALALSPDGTPLWMTRVTTADNVQAFEVMAHPDGGYVLVGRSTESISPFNEIAPVVVKLASDGQLEWSKRYPHPDLLWSWFTRASMAADGDLLVTGRCTGQTNYPQVLRKLAPDGSSCPNCPSADSGSFAALTPIIALEGTFMEAGPWAVEAPFTLSVTDFTSQVVAEVCGTVGIEDIGRDASIFFAPVPFTTHTTLHIPSRVVSSRTKLELFDATGRSVRTRSLRAEATIIDRDALSAGSYVFRITDGVSTLGRGTLQVIDP